MTRKTWVVLGIAALFVSGSVFAADVSNIATESRYDINATGAIDVPTIKSIPANEIRRIADMIDKPESQIGMWVPNVEPEPVIRHSNNSIASNTRVFKNVGIDSDKYPYLIKVVSKRNGHPEDNGWYVYQNVKYNWVYEDAKDGDDTEGEAGTKKASGGKNGASGASVWTPFYKASGEAKAVDYMKNFVTGAGDPTWDPKVYPNAHTKPFDSGISGTNDTRGSTVLQEVGMLLTYQRASAVVTGESGTGYYGDAEPPNPSQPFPTAKLSSVGTFEDKKYEVTPPDGWATETMGILTAYNRVYVEDYKAPTVKGTEVRVYGGNVGGGITKLYQNGQWVDTNGIAFETEDDNPNAKANSDRLQASLNYECGNMDLYRLDNPNYSPDNPTSDSNKAFVYFVYLQPNTNNGKTYGPYIGPAKPAEEFYFYKNLDKYWKNKTEAQVTEYISNRYAHAYSGKSIPAAFRGLAYYILNEGDSGLHKIKNLNGRTSFVAQEISAIVTEYKSLGAKGVQAAADLEAFNAYFAADTISSGTSRYSYIEFKDGGRYCVGPISFDKDSGDYSETQTKDAKKAVWNVNGARVLLPKHYAMNSQEWDNGDINTSLKSAGMDKSGVMNYAADASGTPSSLSSAAFVIPTALSLANTNSQFIKSQGGDWMQKVPDLVFKVDMADCCGNTTNQVGFLQVWDDGNGSKPMPSVSMSDSRSQSEHEVFVPNDESLESGSTLTVKNKDGSGEVVDQGGKYNGDYDLTKKDISLTENGANMTQHPIGSSLTMSDKDKAIYEDVRINISANAYDNIDRFMKNHGISSVSFKIEEISDDGKDTPTGKFESLENDNSGATWDDASHSLVKSGGTDFDPQLKFYHIFRNPGLYKVSYAAADVALAGKDPHTQLMAFRVKVLNQKQDVRTIDTDHERK
ncbi:MAG: hypothetical protein HQM09_22080 [Candidatus Riflebacteria bacterium]|nr:hypothetical protein [Candidatus Riflebacteria bacterium]